VQRTAGTIGQAITFIGTTSVRNICLRYLLDESFKTDNAHIKKIFDALGDASTLASEMCLQLSKKIGLPDAPALMTQVLLSYTGHLAATVLQVGLRGGASRSHSVPLLQRFYGQQQELGLPGPEVGLLLMREWGLPAELAEGVAEIDRVLVTPVDGMAPERAAPLALGYLCARLADRITAGQIEDTRSIETLLELDPDFHHLHGYLALPALSGLREALAAPGA
jgi:HD-like signal output (HDOD) protein